MHHKAVSNDYRPTCAICDLPRTLHTADNQDMPHPYTPRFSRYAKRSQFEGRDWFSITFYLVIIVSIALFFMLLAYAYLTTPDPAPAFYYAPHARLAPRRSRFGRFVYFSRRRLSSYGPMQPITLSEVFDLYFTLDHVHAARRWMRH